MLGGTGRKTLCLLERHRSDTAEQWDYSQKGPWTYLSTCKAPPVTSRNDGEVLEPGHCEQENSDDRGQQQHCAQAW